MKRYLILLSSFIAVINPVMANDDEDVEETNQNDSFKILDHKSETGTTVHANVNSDGSITVETSITTSLSVEIINTDNNNIESTLISGHF